MKKKKRQAILLIPKRELGNRWDDYLDAAAYAFSNAAR